MDHAGFYSATLTYLKAVKAAGSTDPDQVMAAAEEGQDQRHVHASDGYMRADGVMVHDDVRDAGEDPGGVEVSLGLLQGREDHAGRGGLRHATGPACPFLKN